MTQAKYPNRLRELRTARGYRQDHVADAMDFSPATVNRHEQGNRSLDGYTIERYARFYGVPTFEIFVGPHEETLPDATQAE